MRRLLWKELREKRLWFPALLASILGPIAFGQSYLFCGDTPSPWLMASLGVAFLLGAASHSGEIAGEAAGFLRSRPVSWKKALFAKALIGIGMIFASCFLGAIAFRLWCPSGYAEFATFDRLWYGFWTASAVLGCAYGVGFLCSVVLPGVFGGLLTFLAVIMTVVLQVMIYETSLNHAIPSWSVFGWIVGAIAASLVIMRFGLTLPLKQRIKRFAAVVLAFGAAGIILDFACPRVLSMEVSLGGYSCQSISPDGRYALAEVGGVYIFEPRLSRYAIVNMSTSASAQFTLPRRRFNGQWFWTPSGAVYSQRQDRLWVARLANGKAIVRSAKMASGQGEYISYATPSPDGRLVMVRWYPPNPRTEVYDVEQMRKLGSSLAKDAYCWWQSNTEIGYQDRNGKRHIVNVLTGREVVAPPMAGRPGGYTIR